MSDAKDKSGWGFNRRAFIGGAAGAATIPPMSKAAVAAGNAVPAPDPSMPVGVILEINGATKSLDIDARTTLLDALREHVGLPAASKRSSAKAPK